MQAQKQSNRFRSFLPIIVEHLCEHARMPIEEIFVQNGIVVSQRLGKFREASGRNLFQCRFVRFVSDAAYVKDDPILGVHI